MSAPWKNEELECLVEALKFNSGRKLIPELRILIVIMAITTVVWFYGYPRLTIIGLACAVYFCGTVDGLRKAQKELLEALENDCREEE